MRLSLQKFSSAPPRSRCPSTAFHRDSSETFVELRDLGTQFMGVFTAAMDEGFQTLPGVLPNPDTARTDVIPRAMQAFDSRDFSSPQSEVPQGRGLLPRTTRTVPVHRRGRVSPLRSK